MRIKCSHCGQRYDVGQDALGQSVECTSCGQEFIIKMDCVIPKTTPKTKTASVSTSSPIPSKVHVQPRTEDTNVKNTTTATMEQQGSGGGLKALTCEMCGSTDMIKQGGVFVCQSCGTKYSLEEAKKMMIAGTVNVAGTVTVDNSSFVKKSLDNARRALKKDDWEEVEKYYNLVERENPNCIEAVFFSAFAKAMYSLFDAEYFKRNNKFEVLIKSISVISDYYDETTENKKVVLRAVCFAVERMCSTKNFVYAGGCGSGENFLAVLLVIFSSNIGTYRWTKQLIEAVKNAVIVELKQIRAAHPDREDAYLQDLINRLSNLKKSGCYIATAVYGSYDCPEVWTLRRYRDNVLGASWYGRLFIKTYYAISPTVVQYFGRTRIFQKFWRGKLDAFVKKLNDQGISSKPYADKNW